MKYLSMLTILLLACSGLVFAEGSNIEKARDEIPFVDAPHLSNAEVEQVPVSFDTKNIQDSKPAENKVESAEGEVVKPDTIEVPAANQATKEIKVQNRQLIKEAKEEGVAVKQKKALAAEEKTGNINDEGIKPARDSDENVAADLAPESDEGGKINSTPKPEQQKQQGNNRIETKPDWK